MKGFVSILLAACIALYPASAYAANAIKLPNAPPVNIVGYSGGDMINVGITDDIMKYSSLIDKYAERYGIIRYKKLILAVCRQEWGALGTSKTSDLMQSAECKYNKKYDSKPNGIKDVEYSINCGCHYLADCLKAANVGSPNDLDNIKLALQGYNYGEGYIYWAKQRGGYSKENSKLFANMQADRLNMERYGDSNYPAHVFRYYKPSPLWKGLNPNLKAKMEQFIEIARNNGLDVKITETIRTKEQQDLFYAQGRTFSGEIITNAKGSEYKSFHQWGMCFDICQNIKGKEYDEDFLNKCGKIGEYLGLEWGGNWNTPDKCHFELKNINIDYLISMYGRPE